MAIIGTFTQADNGTFTGTITTATLKLKATLRPIDIEGDKAPNYQLLVGTVECGAGWKKTSRQERDRSEEHTSELQSLMRISYAVFCLKKKKTKTDNRHKITNYKHHIKIT